MAGRKHAKECRGNMSMIYDLNMQEHKPSVSIKAPKSSTTDPLPCQQVAESSSSSLGFDTYRAIGKSRSSTQASLQDPQDGAEKSKPFDCFVRQRLPSPSGVPFLEIRCLYHTRRITPELMFAQPQCQIVLIDRQSYGCAKNPILVTILGTDCAVW